MQETVSGAKPNLTKMKRDFKTALSKCLMSNIMYALINAKYICLAVGKYLYLSVRERER